MVRNTAFHLGGQAIALLAALICLPIAFRNLGTEQFAVLMLLWSVLAYATLFDFGIGRAVARATAAALGRGEVAHIPGIFRFGARLQLALGVVAGVALALAAPLLIRVLHIPAELTADVQRAIYAVAVSLPFLLVIQSQQGMFEGHERFDIVAYVRTPINVATYAVPAIGAVLSWSLSTIFVMLLCVRVSAAAILYLLYRNVLKPNRLRGVRPDMREMLRFGGWLTVSAAVIGVMSYGDRFLLAALRGLNDVAQYTAPYDLASKLLLIPGSIGAVLFPALSRLASNEPLSVALQRSRNAGRAAMYVVVPLSLVLIAAADVLLRAWLGPQITNVGITVFRILVFATCLHAVSFAPVVLIEAWGRADIIAKYHLVELPVYIVLLIVAIDKGGAVGAAWVWAARSAWLLVWAHYYVRRWQHVALQRTTSLAV